MEEGGLEGGEEEEEVVHPGSCGGCTSGEGAGGRVRPQLPHNTLHYNTTAQLLHHNTTPQDYKTTNHTTTTTTHPTTHNQTTQQHNTSTPEGRRGNMWKVRVRGWVSGWRGQGPVCFCSSTEVDR